MAYWLRGGAFAQDVVDSNLVQDSNDKSVYSYQFSNSDEIKSLLGSTKFPAYNGATESADNIKTLKITAKDNNGGTLKITHDGTNTGALGFNTSLQGYNFDIDLGTGGKLEIKDTASSKGQTMMLGALSGASRIKGDVEVTDGVMGVINGRHLDETFGGSLAITGNLTLKGTSAKDAKVFNYGGGNLSVSGTLKAENTQFIAGASNYSSLGTNGYYILSAGSFTSDKGTDSDGVKKFLSTEAANSGLVKFYDQTVDVFGVLPQLDSFGDYSWAWPDVNKFTNEIDMSSLLDSKLKVVGNNLYVTTEFKGVIENGKLKEDWQTTLNNNIKTIKKTQKTNLENAQKEIKESKEKTQAAIKFLNETITKLNNNQEVTYTPPTTTIATTVANTSTITKDQLSDVQEALSAYNSRLNALNSLEAQVNGKLANLGSFDSSGNSTFDISKAGIDGKIFESLITSNVGGKAALSADYLLGSKQIINELQKSAKSVSNSALNSPVSAMNMANDMAISNRLAKFSNPFSGVSVASLAGEKFAASNGVASDSSFAYGARTYDNNIWASVVGGANIIDSNSGALYGVSVGYDRAIFDNTILGAYFTYANAEIDTDVINQESDNFQVGLYSRTFINQHELDFKFYGQFASVDQDRRLSAGVQTADFDRYYFGGSLGYGYVFDAGKNFFIKPLVGLNLYYANTEDYTENGVLAQQVNSQSNFDMSVEAGLEMRKYISQDSYVYMTPKIEQYLVTSDDDYVGRFIGSASSFTIGGADKKKTYGSLIFGGDINIKDQFAFTFSAGVKQLFSGKVDDQDETYLSGNIGLKYQF